MRKLLFTMVSGLLLLAPGFVRAQQGHELLKVDVVHIGFMSNTAVANFKAGAWMPVYVDITAGPGPDGVPKSEMVVETADSDDVRNKYTVPVPALEPKEQTTVIGYARPGNMSSEISIQFYADKKQIARTYNDTPAGMDPSNHLYLTIGSRLHTLKMTLDPRVSENEDDTAFAKEDSTRRIAVIEDVRQLPNRWFIYEPIDLMILATGNRDNLNSLLNEQEGRKEAIVEWVRRGGHLIVSVGRNQDIVAGIKAFQPVLPVAITGVKQMPELRGVSRWSGPQPRPFQNLPAKNNSSTRPPIEVAKLEPKPGREIDKLLVEQEDTPLIVRGSYGRGRVVVVAFDLDAPPFTNWVQGGQKDFWRKLLENSAAPPPQEQQFVQRQPFPQAAPSQDLAAQLATNLERFDDVPVISFGWVALFILLYILVVGPLDYFFLKKVVKRLELTWITFPTVVITISVVAYFTAYWLKGNDQKINKLDLLDIDAHSGMVYGNTWFTIFSPRIQNYTIGLEPVTPGWAPSASGEPPSSTTTLTWLGRPDTSFGGTGRSGGTQGLFRRAYDYLPEARGLLHVPIQVWSTKSFSGTWQAPFDPKEELITADLHYSAKNSPLSGTITNKLPVNLENVFIYYPSDTKWYSLGQLVTNVPQRVDAIQSGGAGVPMSDWMGQRNPTQPFNQQPTAPQMGGAEPGNDAIIKRLLFTQYDKDSAKNSTLSGLDQSWRLSHRSEAFLVGRIARTEGLAEELAQAPATPTRLWLGDVPGAGQTRPPLTGNLTQDTYVRIMLPVRTAE